MKACRKLSWRQPSHLYQPLRHHPNCSSQDTKHDSRSTIQHTSLAASFVAANRYRLQTGFLLTSPKQTTVVLSNRYEKPPPGEYRNATGSESKAKSTTERYGAKKGRGLRITGRRPRVADRGSPLVSAHLGHSQPKGGFKGSQERWENEGGAGGMVGDQGLEPWTSPV